MKTLNKEQMKAARIGLIVMLVIYLLGAITGAILHKILS